MKPEPEKTGLDPQQKRTELISLMKKVPEAWLDDLLNIARFGPRYFDSEYRPDEWVNPIDAAVAELTLTVSEWASEAVREWGTRVRMPVVLELPNLEYRRELTAADVAQATGIDIYSDEIDRSLGSVVMTKNSRGELVPSMHEVNYLVRDALANTAWRGLKADGVMRGPCPRCGRQEWLTAYRAPKTRGRRPLDLTYCPLCADIMQQEKTRERKKRYRDKVSESNE